MHFCSVWPHLAPKKRTNIISERRLVVMEARSRLRIVASVHSTNFLGMISISPYHVDVVILQTDEVFYLPPGEALHISKNTLHSHVSSFSATSPEGT